jgi:hypothetical protein
VIRGNDSRGDLMAVWVGRSALGYQPPCVATQGWGGGVGGISLPLAPRACIFDGGRQGKRIYKVSVAVRHSSGRQSHKDLNLSPDVEAWRFDARLKFGNRLALPREAKRDWLALGRKAGEFSVAGRRGPRGHYWLKGSAPLRKKSMSRRRDWSRACLPLANLALPMPSL